ncbi:MAG: TetR-like C-terminal domain-containing protein [Mycobacteriales bacterium]
MTEQLGAAVMGRACDDAVRALMLAYRRYVLDNPHRYALFDQTPSPDPLIQMLTQFFHNGPTTPD